MTTELLSVQEICVNYGAVNALEQVSIHVDGGEVVTVIGSNGAGKTTLMKTIAGLLESRSGAIWFTGQDITATEAHALVGRGISLVPEGRQVFGRMSVEENLVLGAYSRPGGALEGDFEHCFALFPACASAGASGPERCPEVSSRCWPLHADSCPGPGSCSWTSRPSASLRNW